MVGCRVTAKSDERASIFVCGLSYGLRMKVSAGSLNRELNLRTCSSVSFRCPARNIDTPLSDPNSGVKSRCVKALLFDEKPHDGNCIRFWNCGVRLLVAFHE